jgi:biotin synthase
MLPAMTLSKIIAAIVLTFAGSKTMPWMGSHEPTTHAFLSGSNMITAESGINPRDTVLDTENNRGWSITRCKSMLKSTGYKYITRGDGSLVEL